MTLQSDTHGKALSLNLEGRVYGTFAEIGAGQEVARWFLSVGAASGTVAKTICAYDKKISDEIYGAGTRYVSKERLVAMLDREYNLLLDRLGPTRGKDARFFVFADTVATRNFHGTNEPHGWVGIRFQAEPGIGAEPDVASHESLRLHGATAAAGHWNSGSEPCLRGFSPDATIDTFLAGLFDELSTARTEIDVIDVSGPAFANKDRANGVCHC